MSITVNDEAVENGGTATWTSGENEVVITVETVTSTETYTVTVTYTPEDPGP